MAWFGIFLTLMSILFVVWFVWVLYKPNFLRNMLAIYMPSIDHTPAENVIQKENWALYSNTPTPKNLVVFFNGGAFCYSDKASSFGMLNQLSVNLGSDYDILTFDYPVRFNHTLKETLCAINTTLSQFQSKYENFYALSLSAGCLLAGTFIKKETDAALAEKIQVPQIKLTFKAFIGINGIYNTELDNDIANALFSGYITRGSPNVNLYSAYNLTIPKMVVDVTDQFLFVQGKKFLTSETVEERVVYTDADGLGHSFILYPNIIKTKETLEKISNFIKKIADGTLKRSLMFRTFIS